MFGQANKGSSQTGHLNTANIYIYIYRTGPNLGQKNDFKRYLPTLPNIPQRIGNNNLEGTLRYEQNARANDLNDRTQNEILLRKIYFYLNFYYQPNLLINVRNFCYCVTKYYYSSRKWKCCVSRKWFVNKRTCVLQNETTIL